jgi:putative oxidoreductase
MRFGLAVLRIVTGLLLMGHGLQKLKGWFGGHGLAATGQAFEGMGLRPGKAHATASGISETLGGALLATGFLTPLGAALITGGMTVAIERVHLKNGPWVADGGYEYNLVLIASAFALSAAGPGALSLDDALGTGRRGAGVALAELAAGAAGGAAVIARARQASAGEPSDGQGPPAA